MRHGERLAITARAKWGPAPESGKAQAQAATQGHRPPRGAGSSHKHAHQEIRKTFALNCSGLQYTWRNRAKPVSFVRQHKSDNCYLLVHDLLLVYNCQTTLSLPAQQFHRDVDVRDDLASPPTIHPGSG
jgi:hypothetical protein